MLLSALYDKEIGVFAGLMSAGMEKGSADRKLLLL